MNIFLKNTVLTIICGSCFLVNPLFGSDDEEQSDKLPEIGTYTNPIELKGIKDIVSIEYRQEDYIKEHYEGYDIKVVSYSMHANRFIQSILIENEKKDKKCIYFDMTDIYKKLSTSKDKKTREKVAKMKKWHLPADPNRPPKASDNPFL